MRAKLFLLMKLTSINFACTVHLVFSS